MNHPDPAVADAPWSAAPDPAGPAGVESTGPAGGGPTRPAGCSEPAGAGEAGGEAAAGWPGPGVRRRLVRLADAVLRVLGAVLSVIAALASGLLELLWLPLRFQGQLVGVSILMAVVGNVALAWFARHTVGRRWAMVLPWGAWTALMFLAAGSTTTEGDYLLSASNWVALPMILLGSVAFGVYSYRQILAPRPPRTGRAAASSD